LCAEHEGQPGCLILLPFLGSLHGSAELVQSLSPSAAPCQAKKHLRPKLLATAAAAGVTIKVVNFGQPLADQGPFDVLLHKIRKKGVTRE